MARVSDADVREIFDTDIGDLDPWIAIATQAVDDIADKDSDITSSRLSTIEKLLTAHFASAQDPRFARETVGDVSANYQGEWSQGIMSTSYGQQAAMLDTTGTLRASDKPKANVRALDSRNIE